jgi:5'-deoxynucleotidase YfbR-like HD superfamily hydrolase
LIVDVSSIIRLSDLLSELGNIDRATFLPSGIPETDSHHSFMLALVAYNICQEHCPELDINKVMLFALTHDLLEIITGDEDTLHLDAEALAAKHAREQAALKDFDKLFAGYPLLKDAMYEYDKLDTPEAATVFVLDKACTTWTHMHDRAQYVKTQRDITSQQHVEAWAERQRQKMQKRLKVMPPQAILDVFEESFVALKGVFDE